MAALSNHWSAITSLFLTLPLSTRCSNPNRGGGDRTCAVCEVWFGSFPGLITEVSINRETEWKSESDSQSHVKWWHYVPGRGPNCCFWMWIKTFTWNCFDFLHRPARHSFGLPYNPVNLLHGSIWERTDRKLLDGDWRKSMEATWAAGHFHLGNG